MSLSAFAAAALAYSAQHASADIMRSYGFPIPPQTPLHSSFYLGYPLSDPYNYGYTGSKRAPNQLNTKYVPPAIDHAAHMSKAEAKRARKAAKLQAIAEKTKE